MTSPPKNGCGYNPIRTGDLFGFCNQNLSTPVKWAFYKKMLAGVPPPANTFNDPV
jgi:hypothetical protein